MHYKNCCWPFIFVYLILGSCTAKDQSDTLFSVIDSDRSNIHFENNLQYTKEMNPYTYRNFYNGGGVGIADFNGDGLQDLFFTGNQVSNKLYLNNGDFTFTDITQRAGVASAGVWSTGVSIVDINADGRPDIYVSKSGRPGGDERHNQFFINMGDSTFTDKANAYGLAVEQLSVDATFFDYDRDGDLDMYLLNNSFEPVTDLHVEKGLREQPSSKGGNKLFRNETIRNGVVSDSMYFTEVTEQAGIYSSPIGFGLDVLVGFINNDNWPDVYVTNDFFERDYLYLNNQDGTFKEVLPEHIPSLSLSSMGGDMADINHDGRTDIFVADMRPESFQRLKSATLFDDWHQFEERLSNGYERQHTQNTLFLHSGFRGDATTTPSKDFYYSEIARMAGVAATDWSWTSLFADLDLDGHQDLFVTSGVYKDLNNQDYLSSNQTLPKIRSIVENDAPVSSLFDALPSTPLSNYAFKGSDSLSFQNKSATWGLDEPGFSNGAAYSDLDNDGDLDLITNDVNGKAQIYENHAAGRSRNHQLTITLKGASKNSAGIGARMAAWVNGIRYYREQMPNRGFMSSQDARLHVGLGEASRVDSIIVRWPSGKRSYIKNVPADTSLTIREAQAIPADTLASPSKPAVFTDITDKVQLGYAHRDDRYNAFDRTPMQYQMYAQEGPAACVADINKDGRDDIYLGGAKSQAGAIFIQEKNLRFRQLKVQAIEQNRVSEEVACTWFDADQDGDKDLYVASGSSEFPASSSALSDWLYLNSSGTFTDATDQLPVSRFEATGTVSAGDFDGDGDSDLFTGSRLQPFAYGLPVDGHLLENDGNGTFTEITKEQAPGLQSLGMITSSQWIDFENDGDLDLLIAGEWMPIKLFKNQLNETGNAIFTDVSTSAGFDATSGLWQSLLVDDLNNDGYPEVVAGNFGLNSIFEASPSRPLRRWVNDFDSNGSIESIISISTAGGNEPLMLKHDLTAQMPSFESTVGDYKTYASGTMESLFSPAQRSSAKTAAVVKLESMVFWNRQGTFKGEALPRVSQITPLVAEQNGPEQILLTGGNIADIKPFIGDQMKGYGGVLKHAGEALLPVPFSESGFKIPGKIRAILPVHTTDKIVYLIVRNNDVPLWFEVNDQ